MTVKYSARLSGASACVRLPAIPLKLIERVHGSWSILFPNEMAFSARATLCNAKMKADLWRGKLLVAALLGASPLGVSQNRGWRAVCKSHFGRRRAERRLWRSLFFLSPTSLYATLQSLSLAGTLLFNLFFSSAAETYFSVGQV